MTASIDQVKRVGVGLYRADFSSTESEPVYTVYLNGRRLGETTGASYTFSVPDGEAVILDVIDQSETADLKQFEFYNAHALITWGHAAGAVHYLVEQWDGADWQIKTRIQHDGRRYYQWRSERLADDATHQFRVKAVDAGGRESTTTALSLDMVRYPDPPDVNFSYDDGTRELTIDAN